jgi:hypothetical protein
MSTQSFQGKSVRFFIKDVRVPEPARIFAALHGNDLLRGRVIDLTETGVDAEAFAVVDVAELAQPVVVPTLCLQQED